MDPSLILYSSAIKIDYNVHRLDHLTVEDNLADGVLVSAFFLSLYLLLLLICDWLFSFMSLAVCCRHNSLLCEAVLQFDLYATAIHSCLLLLYCTSTSSFPWFSFCCYCLCSGCCHVSAMLYRVCQYRNNPLEKNSLF